MAISVEVSRDVMLAALRAGPEAWKELIVHLRKAQKPCDFLDEDLQEIDFSNVVFPTYVRFDGSRFNDVKFVGTIFEQGASFIRSTFGGLTEVNMFGGRNDLTFDRATFNGHLRIRHLNEIRSISFVGTHFKEGVSARGPDKHNALQWPVLMFQQVRLQGDLTLENCSFHAADFQQSHLGMKLDGAIENMGQVSFRNSTFRLGVNFSRCEFYGSANFENTEFLGSSFFEGTIFNRAPNFHDAKLHQGTRFSPKDQFPLLFRDLRHPGAAEAYRTLKLAMNKQHALNEELGFFLLEMRATAHRLPKWQQVPYHLYDWLSMYGLSVVRPISWYALSLLFFGLIYSALSGQRWETLDSRLTALALHGAMPFATALRWSEIGEAGSAFPADRFVLVQMAVVAQSIVSAALLFLIALGLRNMFKVR